MAVATAAATGVVECQIAKEATAEDGLCKNESWPIRLQMGTCLPKSFQYIYKTIRNCVCHMLIDVSPIRFSHRGVISRRHVGRSSAKHSSLAFKSLKEAAQASNWFMKQNPNVQKESRASYGEIPWDSFY